MCYFIRGDYFFKDCWCFHYLLEILPSSQLLRGQMYFLYRVFATFWFFVLLIWCPNRHQ
jgi:hypothetical protein